jgi:hypothetical protein
MPWLLKMKIGKTDQGTRIIAACSKCGFEREIDRKRLKRLPEHDCDPEVPLFIRPNNNARRIQICGLNLTIAQWASVAQIDKSIIYRRLADGKVSKQAVFGNNPPEDDALEDLIIRQKVKEAIPRFLSLLEPIAESILTGILSEASRKYTPEASEQPPEAPKQISKIRADAELLPAYATKEESQSGLFEAPWVVCRPGNWPKNIFQLSKLLSYKQREWPDPLEGAYMRKLHSDLQWYALNPVHSPSLYCAYRERFALSRFLEQNQADTEKDKLSKQALLRFQELQINPVVMASAQDAPIPLFTPHYLATGQIQPRLSVENMQRIWGKSYADDFRFKDTLFFSPEAPSEAPWEDFQDNQSLYWDALEELIPEKYLEALLFLASHGRNSALWPKGANPKIPQGMAISVYADPAEAAAPKQVGNLPRRFRTIY